MIFFLCVSFPTPTFSTRFVSLPSSLPSSLPLPYLYIYIFLLFRWELNHLGGVPSTLTLLKPSPLPIPFVIPPNFPLPGVQPAYPESPYLVTLLLSFHVYLGKMSV